MKLIMRESTENTKIETSICPLCRENKVSKIGNEYCAECSCEKCDYKGHDYGLCDCDCHAKE